MHAHDARRTGQFHHPRPSGADPVPEEEHDESGEEALPDGADTVRPGPRRKAEDRAPLVLPRRSTPAWRP